MKIHKFFSFIFLSPLLAYTEVTSSISEVSHASASFTGITNTANSVVTVGASTSSPATVSAINAASTALITSTTNAANTSASTGLLQIFLALIFVICLMLFGAWLLKRINPIMNNHKINVKVVGGTSLGNRERVVVLEIADQWIVVGVTATQINTLSTMQKIDMSTEEKNTAAMPNQFSSWLKKTIDKRSNEAS